MLNDRLSWFDYERNKVVKKDGTKIWQSASQMISLTQSFSGDLIPFEDEHFVSFLLLLRICTIALSPICTHDTVMYLRVLIEEKLSNVSKAISSIES